MNNLMIIIPTYDPDGLIMTKFVNELKLSFKNIVIVNDGSNATHNEFFNKLKKEGFIVINHYKNLGKGRAIKNAFNYILNEYKNIEGVVTCDCDGQHSVKDIINVSKLIKDKDSFILGTRSFKRKDVPFKSRFGNNLTRDIFRFFIGLKVTDTQTGLRAFGKNRMIEFMDIAGERYEYETNMLITSKHNNIPIIEKGIETIYLDQNKGSHFRPIRDSYRIYRLFFRYLMASFSSFALDIIGFSILLILFHKTDNSIIIATILARVFSSIWNYFINANLVFNSSSKRAIIMYYILALIQVFISAFLVTYFHSITVLSVIIIKILVDIAIFVINFIVQSEIIFIKENYEK